MRNRLVRILVVLGIVASVCFGVAASVFAATTLSFWLRGNEQMLKAYQYLADEYEKMSGVRVKPELFPEVEDKLLTAMIGHQGPDMWVAGVITTGRWAKYGMAVPIDRKAVDPQGMIMDRAWSFVQGADDRYYGVPFNVQTNALHIRTDWLKKVGKKAPTTWDELIDVAKAFTYGDPDGNGKNDTYGLVILGGSTKGYGWWYWQGFLWEAGGSVLRSTGNGTYKCALDSPEALKALELYRDLGYKYKVAQPGFATAISRDGYNAFKDDIAGMIIHGPYQFMIYDPVLAGKYTAVPVPRGPANADVLGEGEAIYISSQTSKKKQALDFAIWLTSKDAQLKAMTNQYINVVRLSIRKDVTTADVVKDPRFQPFVEAFANNARSPEAIPDFYAVRLIVGDMIQEALASPDADLRSIVKKYGVKVNDELKKQGVYGE